MHRKRDIPAYMDKRFKWNMFITSFIPLWLSIIVVDVWSVIEYGLNNWSHKRQLICNLECLVLENVVCISVILIIFILMLISIWSINIFIRDKCSNDTPPKVKIKKALRANKLSTEFLLAYILPMIAFDFTELKSVVLFVIYFAMLTFLCIRNNNVYINIWLEFKGYKMYTCDIEAEKLGRPHKYNDCLVISKNDLTTQIDKQMECWDFNNYIYIDLR